MRPRPDLFAIRCEDLQICFFPSISLRFLLRRAICSRIEQECVGSRLLTISLDRMDGDNVQEREANQAKQRLEGPGLRRGGNSDLI